MEKIKNYCFSFSSVFPMIWILLKISADNIRNIGRKQNFRYGRNYANLDEKFLLFIPVGYITADFKKMVSYIFRADSTLVESCAGPKVEAGHVSTVSTFE